MSYQPEFIPSKENFKNLKKAFDKARKEEMKRSKSGRPPSIFIEIKDNK